MKGLKHNLKLLLEITSYSFEIKICQEFQFINIFKMTRGFSLNAVEILKTCKIDISCQALVP